MEDFIMTDANGYSYQDYQTYQNYQGQEYQQYAGMTAGAVGGMAEEPSQGTGFTPDGHYGQTGQGRRLGTPRKEDWWEAQGAKSFIKLEPMFDGEKYASKMIFSFVKHNGAANGYKRTDNIKIYVPVSGGGVSNGETGQKQVTGQNAESLASMIRSGDMYRMCVASKKAAQATGQQYPQPLFQTIGGSAEKRGTDGSVIPVKFRKFTIAPNMMGDGYLFTAMECDGFKTKTGGYAPAQGMPNRRNILVPVPEHAMRGLGENIIAHWNAYLTAMEIKDILGR